MQPSTVSPIINDRGKLVIANKLLLALHRNDWDLMATLIADRTTWSFPGKNPLSGITKGAAETIAKARQLMSYPLSYRLNNIQVSYSGFALSVHCNTLQPGNRLNQEVVLACTLLKDKIIVIKTYLSDVINMNEFFGSKVYDERHVNDLCPTVEQCKSVANTFLAAMKSNNWPLLQSLMLPSIEWTLPGSSVLSGPATGIEAVIKRAQSLKKFGVMFNLLHVLYGWNGVALSLYNTAKRGDITLSEYVTIVFKIDGEHISRLTTHLSDVSGIEQFFIPGIIDQQAVLA